MTTTDLIADLLDAARRAAAATGPRRESIQRLLIRKASELRDRRDRLVERLTAGWNWFIGNEQHPGYAEAEAKWLTWLHQLESIEDALNQALDIWLPVPGIFDTEVS